MPFDLHIIRAHEFVRLDAREQLNFGASQEALATLARACWKRGLQQAMLDLRPLPIPPKPLFTPSELAKLVETFREEGFGRNHRLAILYRSDPHGGAKMFAFLSRLKGWQVQAFNDFEEALMWLSKEQTGAGAESGLPVPIKFVAPKSKPTRQIRIR